MIGRAFQPLVRRVLNQNRVGTRSAAHYDQKSALPTMDDLPVPNGSWETQFKAKQAKYNMHLAAGVVIAAITAIAAKASGLIYLNYSPPPYPFKED